MEIIEALNIVSDFIEGEYQYQDEEGEWYVKPEAIKAMQVLINYGMVQHLAEWYRDKLTDNRSLATETTIDVRAKSKK